MSERFKGNVAVITDGGGRGSVLVDRYSKSDVEKIIAIPGNDLMQINSDVPVELHPELRTTSKKEIIEICEEHRAKGYEILVDAAQDNAVEVGLVDDLTEDGFAVVGPTRAAGQIEWDKVWAREFGSRHELPQPRYKTCVTMQEGVEYFLEELGGEKAFIKYPLLAAGKGALPAEGLAGVRTRVQEIYDTYGDGGAYLVEDWLKGEDDWAEEFSTFVLSDGTNFKVIGSARDHKRAFDFDKGENTGGMGCSTPPLFITPELLRKIEEDILRKTIEGLKAEGRPYKGVLYLGGMAIKENGQINPYVIEFNARWGDPEAQVLAPSITSDLLEIGMAVAAGDISNLDIRTDGKARVVVTGASKGYPGDYGSVKGKQIFGIDEARKMDGVKIYGAGVRRIDGKDYANGGRLFYVMGEGNNVNEAIEKAYGAMKIITVDGDGLHFRTDIGLRDVQRLKTA